MVKQSGLLSFLCAAAAIASRAHEFSPFQAGDGGWHLSAPAVGNVDDDPALEIVLSYRDSSSVWHLDAFDYDGTRLPGFPHRGGNSPINASPTLWDVDGDGRSEIIFTQGNRILTINGEDASLLWSREVTPGNYQPNGGFQSTTGNFYLTSDPLPQATLPATAQFFSEVSPPIIVDLEGDGSFEVLTAWKIDPDPLSRNQDYNPVINDIFGLTEWGATGEVWSGGVIISDARSGATEFIYHFHQLVESGLALAQVDEDRPVEVLVLNDADSVVAFDITEAPGLFGSGMLHRMFGKNLRLLSGSYLTGVDAHSADLDGDGRSEVLVSSSPLEPNWQPSETILDDDGSVLWREWNAEAALTNFHGWLNSATLIPVNPDWDNRIDVMGYRHTPEITFRTWNGVELVSRPGWPKNFAPELPTPPVVGDVDGDGADEIVIGTYHPAQNPSQGRLFVFALDGTQKFVLNVPGGLKHIPAIADVDRDGHTEVIYRGLDGKVYIQSFGAGDPSRVSWAGHRGGADRLGGFGRDLFPPGTPRAGTGQGAWRTAALNWSVPDGFEPSSFRIYRASSPAGPFEEVAALDSSARSFIDSDLVPGGQYLYEIEAVYADRAVRSAPIPILVQLNDSLITNGGFEADDDAGWDKWFTGEITWDRMTGTSAEAHGGSRSMEVRLEEDGNNSSITQYSHYGTPEDYLPVTPGVLYSFGGFMKSTGMTQPTSHWLEWDSSRTAADTNARPPLPWPSYFTPSLEAGPEPTGWVYLNRVFTMPAGFPNVELRHRLSVEGRASGSVFLDDIFFRPLPAPEDERWQEWISFGAQWRYLAAEPPDGWFAPEFDASAWPLGEAKFGRGGGPRDIVTPLPKNQPGYYFRRQFVVPEGRYHEFLLAATCTDDYGGQVYPLRIWLNGTEVVTGGIEAVSGTGNVVKYFDLAPFLDLVQPGTNTVAVKLANTWEPDWDDVAFDVSLRAVPMEVAGGGATATVGEVAREPDGSISFIVTACAPSTWRVESAEATTPLQWEAVGLVVFSSPGSRRFTDRGQNGRGFPASVKTRLYRLVKI